MRKVLPVLLVLLFGMQALAADIYIPGSALRPLLRQNVEWGQFAERVFGVTGLTQSGTPPLLTDYRFKGIEMPFVNAGLRGFEAQYKYTGWTKVKEVWVQMYRVPGGPSGGKLCVQAANYVVQHHYPAVFSVTNDFNYQNTDADRFSAPIQSGKIPMINGVYTVASVLDVYNITFKLKDHADSGTLVDLNASGGNPFGQGNLFCLNNALFNPAKIELTGECRVDTDLTAQQRADLINALKGADAIFEFVSYDPFCTNDYQGTMFATGVRLTVE
jgi:hypothetical protein